MSCFVDVVAEGGEKKTFTLQAISSEPSNVTEENEGSEVGKILKNIIKKHLTHIFRFDLSYGWPANVDVLPAVACLRRK